MYSGIVGFVIQKTRSQKKKDKLQTLVTTFLKDFPWLKQSRHQLGATIIYFWGHNQIDSFTYETKRTWWLICGSATNLGWQDITKLETKPTDSVKLEGRYVIVAVDKRTEEIRFWTDWSGSLPIYYDVKKRIWSSVEPLIVRYSDYTLSDVRPPQLVSLLYLGYLLENQGLYTDLSLLPPDSFSHFTTTKIKHKRLATITPNDEFQSNSLESLLPKYKQLIESGMLSSLVEKDFILPLSAGLDSRIWACVLAKQGIKPKTFTYGTPQWYESIYAKQVANKLDLDWTLIDPGDYLTPYTKRWFEWFGSSLHAHGMYQYPFLEHLKSQSISGPILSGYLGDPLAGSHYKKLLEHSTHDPLQGLIQLGTLSDISTTKALIGKEIDVDKNLEKASKLIRQTYETLSGSHAQRLLMIDLYNRQRRFVSYQPLMYDYYNGLLAGFLNKEYAQFCFSLPLEFLSDRKLQIAYMAKYYPDMAKIGGSFGPPTTMTTRYRLANLLRNQIGNRLPRQLARRLKLVVDTNRLQTNALRQGSKEALWPLNQKSIVHNLNQKQVSMLIQQSVQTPISEEAYNKLRPIQTLVWITQANKTI